MELEFAISGGRIRVRKTAFIKEMLGAGSVLKKLLDYDVSSSGKARVLSVDRTRETDAVVVDFTAGSDIRVGEDFSALLEEAKTRLGRDITGQVTLVAHYYSMITVVLDLDSDDGSIRIVHQGQVGERPYT